MASFALTKHNDEEKKLGEIYQSDHITLIIETNKSIFKDMRVTRPTTNQDEIARQNNKQEYNFFI